MADNHLEQDDTTPQQGRASLPPNGDVQNDYFGVEDDERFSDDGFSARARRRASLSIKIPPLRATADMAFTALQYLPMPVLVLSDSKQVLLANEAMGRLLGISLDDESENETSDEDDDPESNIKSITDTLYGLTLSQLGLDLLQGGNPVFVAWEDFLETLVDDATKAQCSTTQLNIFHGRGSPKLPSPASRSGKSHRRSVSQASSLFNKSRGSKTEVHDAVVEVVFSTNRDNQTGLPTVSRHDAANHVQARMIVSVWATEDSQYFTLTFTASGQTDTVSEASKTTSRTVSRHSTSLASGLSSESSSNSSGPLKSGYSTSTATSITSASNMASPRSMEFPPKGPPGKPSTSSPSMFSKTNRLKDSILNTMNIPAYAMWKDESFGVPNKAAMKLVYPWLQDGAYDSNEQAKDFLNKFVLYNEDFSAKIPIEDFPISKVMRDQKSFDGYRVGMYSVKDGSRMLYDTSGEPITDDKGEFLGGLVMFKDITDFAATISQQQKENESMFENICNSAPILIWRNTPDGAVDYLSERWLTYTGTSIEMNTGHAWTGRIHPDDLPNTAAKWAHTLETGEEYLVEYRLRRADGDWRWMLARAVPIRDEDGKITNYFGSCTDIHELVNTREEAKQTREQLRRVVQHAQIALWAVDKEKRLTLFEGKPMGVSDPAKLSDPEEEKRAELWKKQHLGLNVYEILRSQGREDEIKQLWGPINDVLEGKNTQHTYEAHINTNQRWFKSRLFPLLRQERTAGKEGEAFIDGVVGISMDITEYKNKTDEVEQRNLENSRLLAQTVAAREASKMKSQVCRQDITDGHEIATTNDHG